MGSRPLTNEPMAPVCVCACVAHGMEFTKQVCVLLQKNTVTNFYGVLLNLSQSTQK